MTKMAQLHTPFSLSRQWYQVLPPLCIHFASIAHSIQIACVMLEIAYTKVLMECFDILIESSYKFTTTANTKIMYQCTPKVSPSYHHSFHIQLGNIIPPNHCHRHVTFFICLHKLVHMPHYEYQSATKLITPFWWRDQVNLWELGYLRAPRGDLGEPQKIGKELNQTTYCYGHTPFLIGTILLTGGYTIGHHFPRRSSRVILRGKYH